MLDWVLRILHIGPAIFLAGGVFFMWVALIPAMSTLNEETRESMFQVVRGRWSKVVMICTLLLLVTGITNAVTLIKNYDFDIDKLYHGLVMVKLGFALGVFFITAVLSGRSAMAAKFRERIQYWMTINVVLVVLLIVIATGMGQAERVSRHFSYGGDLPVEEMPSDNLPVPVETTP